MLNDEATEALDYSSASTIYMHKEDNFGIIQNLDALVVGERLLIDEQDDYSFGRYVIDAIEDLEDSVTFTVTFVTGRGEATSGEIVAVKAFPDVDIDDKADIVYVDAQDALKLNLTGGVITGKVSLQGAALSVNGPNVGSANNFVVKDANGNNSLLVQGTPGGVFVDGKKVATQEYVDSKFRSIEQLIRGIK